MSGTISKGVMGFVSGLFIALVFLVMLPVAFYSKWFYMGISGIIVGVLIMLYLEKKFGELSFFKNTLIMGLSFLVGIGLVFMGLMSAVTAFFIAMLGGLTIYSACGYVLPEHEKNKVVFVAFLCAIFGFAIGSVLFRFISAISI